MGFCRLLSLVVYVGLLGITLVYGVDKDNQDETTPKDVIPLGFKDALPPSDAETGAIADVEDAYLRNNITISQSKLVLSRWNQLKLLPRLIKTVDSASDMPKLAARMSDSVGKTSSGNMMKSPSGGGGGGGMKRVLANADRVMYREAFLFALRGHHDHCMPNDASPHCRSAPSAIITIGNTNTRFGFGWRYPMMYWRVHGDSLISTCSYARAVGDFFYC